ncbi:MAG: hypothetical protein C5B50_03165 [Verrucomicrobia bacterium]|nr:MAG: hypothetical protein C5B50_03165 [Verrucomicrobiota bacterium]
MKPNPCIGPPKRWGQAILLLIFLFSFPGPTLTHADIIYVSNWNNSTVDSFDSFTGTYFGVFAYPAHPRGTAVDSTGNVFVASYSSGSLIEYTPSGSSSVFATGLAYPEGLAFDSSGNLYEADYVANTIYKYTPAGVRSVFANTGLRAPYGLAFDSAGNLYAANNGANTIEKFTPAGVGSVFANTGLTGPIGLAFDSAGNLYAANYGGGSIEKFTAQGAGSVFATGLADPSGLAFDSAGNLFVADQWGGPTYGRIMKYTPTGVGSVFFNGYYTGPVYVAIQPVPEPSVWILLLLGCALLRVIRGLGYWTVPLNGIRNGVRVLPGIACSRPPSIPQSRHFAIMAG